MANGNSVHDEIREQQRKLKGKSPKEKFLYFWEYYRVHTFVTIFAVILVASFIHSIVTQKDTQLHAVFVNGYFEGDTDAEAWNLCTYLGGDPDKVQPMLDFNFIIDYEAMDQYSMANLQKFMAMTAASDLDVVVMNQEVLENYAQQDLFLDLSETLPAELVEAYEDQFLYYDVPDDGKGEIPVAVCVADAPYLTSRNMYGNRQDVYYAIIGNTVRLDESIRFLEYLYDPASVLES